MAFFVLNLVGILLTASWFSPILRNSSAGSGADGASNWQIATSQLLMGKPETACNPTV
jgi:hypothetical protein